VLWLNRFQIAQEEQALLARFGSSYAAYCRRVRRWL
jgi:protein-S-isoprenylcysteine O-methyltransferase Ste14